MGVVENKNKMKRAKITQDVIEQIAVLNSEGKSNTEIAGILKISRVSVHRYAPKDATKLKTKERTIEIRRLHSEGFIQSEIADHLGINVESLEIID